MRIYQFPLVLIAVMLFASCGNQDETEFGSAKATEFSAEEKLAARSLSIGNHATLDATAPPFEEALRCRIAVDFLVSRFDEGDALQDDQARAMHEVVVHYQQRVAALGQKLGLSADEIEVKSRELQDEMELAGQEGATAIACLQRLQEFSLR